MFCLYSKGCEYTIRALTCVLNDTGRRGFLVKEICRRAKVPEPFTRKAFQKLAKNGFLKVLRGPGGGYQLTRDPGQISILELIKAVDGKEVFEQCVMGLAQCEDKEPCPIHVTWKRVKSKVIAELGTKTLEQLMALPDSKKGLRKKIRI
jgi:Rrf2 family transcriptional regulator, iron-sulfur cluster assembly transcription factor